MSTLLDPPRTVHTVAPGDRLRTTMAAARLSFTWLGVRKTLTSAQKNQAADTFGAEGKFLSAGKKLLNYAPKCVLWNSMTITNCRRNDAWLRTLFRSPPCSAYHM